MIRTRRGGGARLRPWARSGAIPPNNAWRGRRATTRPEFTAAYHGLKKPHRSHPRQQVLDGYGGMVGLAMRGGAAAAQRFCAGLKVFTHAPSLAGVDSLISEPRLTSHKSLSAEERTAQGIPDGFLRVSCGCEDAPDLIADLAGAF